LKDDATFAAGSTTISLSLTNLTGTTHAVAINIEGISATVTFDQTVAVKSINLYNCRLLLR
jgi:hypothetical protein